MKNRRRGSSLIEFALAWSLLAVLMAGIMQVSLAGFAANSVAFAAQRAARYACVRGSASGHPATPDEIGGIARQSAGPLAADDVTVGVSYTPNNNNPGSVVQVTVSYAFGPGLALLSDNLTVRTVATQIIVQ